MALESSGMILYVTKTNKTKNRQVGGLWETSESILARGRFFLGALSPVMRHGSIITLWNKKMLSKGQNSTLSRNSLAIEEFYSLIFFTIDIIWWMWLIVASCELTKAAYKVCSSEMSFSPWQCYRVFHV